MDKQEKLVLQREHTKLRQELADDGDTFSTWSSYFRDAFRKHKPTATDNPERMARLASDEADGMLARYLEKRGPFQERRDKIVARLHAIDEELE